MTTGDLERARALLELDRAREARVLLRSALAQEPENADALCLLAQACLATDDPAGAISAARGAVRTEPDKEWAHRLLSLALVRCARVDEAVLASIEALRLAPNQWRGHMNRAVIDLTGRRVSPVTVEYAQRAVALAPHEAEPHAVLGRVLLDLNEAGPARRALLEALRLNPDNYSARNDLARADLRRHRLGRAARGFADAAVSSVGDQAAAHNLHLVLAQLLRRLHLLLLVAVLVIGSMAANASTTRLARGTVWLVVAAAAAAILHSGHLGSRRRTRRVIGTVLRRDRLLTAWAVCLLVTGAAVTVGAFAGRAVANDVTPWGWLTLITGTVLSWVRRQHRAGRW
ncbi:tetratricopeptide repeat protein [uncultured Jatrophihabitans sp.]|uniref:tetratricopeptide repeat protein n=1 Tax=uncultured Jatrophihabitans sp. TaxID=1610747 RepID=UPI0035C9BFA4